MELTSLKEILLKKSEGNKNLATMIEYMGEKQLFNSVVESLEKMARMGRNANAPTRAFGKTADITDTDQLRDAIGHHLGHYKAALKAHHAAPEGSPEKANYRKAADAHIEKALPLLHLAGKSAHHSKGKLMLKYPSMMPWEANYTSMKQAGTGTGRLHRDPKGLSAYTVKTKTPKGDDGYGISDFHYLEMPPNPGHSKVKGMPFTGGYPFEEIQFGQPEEVDSKKAYLHIPDVENKGKFEPHPFDKHPLSSMHKVSHSTTSDGMKDQYAKDLAAFRSSPEHDSWLESQEQQEKNDPNYATRGHTKGSHFYEGIPLKEQRAHVNDYPHVPRGSASEENWETEQGHAGDDDADEVTPTAAAPMKATPPQVKKKGAAAEPGAHPLDKMYQAWKTLSPDHQQSMLEVMPALKKLVNERGGK